MGLSIKLFLHPPCNCLQLIKRAVDQAQFDGHSGRDVLAR
jgi:hypothetical protein